jgi:hypothetical protein
MAHEVAHERAPYGVMSNGSSSQTPAHGSPVTLRTVLPHASRLERPDLAEDAQHLRGVAQRDVVELEVLARRDVALDQRRELPRRCRRRHPSGPALTPPSGSLIRIIWRSGWRWP